MLKAKVNLKLLREIIRRRREEKVIGVKRKFSPKIYARGNSECSVSSGSM